MPRNKENIPSTDTSHTDEVPSKKKEKKKKEKGKKWKSLRHTVPASPPSSPDPTTPPAADELFESNAHVLSHTSSSEPTSSHPSPTPESRKRPGSRLKSGRSKKKGKKNEESDNKEVAVDKAWTTAGRFWTRDIDPWADPYQVILHGLEAKTGKEKSYDALQMAFEHVMDPDEPNYAVLRNFLSSSEYILNPMTIDTFLKKMKDDMLQARGDDTGKLKNSMLELLAAEDDSTIKLFRKKDMGWNDESTARLLCPIQMLEEFDDNPTMFRARVINKEKNEKARPIKILPHAWGLFLYDESMIDLKDPTSGLFRGWFLIRIFKHVFLGSGIPSDTHTTKKAPVARIHKIRHVTGRHIAYAALQARFLLSSAGQWGEVDQGFNFRSFYYGIVSFFETKRKGSKGILKWWSENILGTNAWEDDVPAPSPDSHYAMLMAESDPESQPQGDNEESNNPTQ